MKKHIYSIIAFAVFAASALASEGTELNINVPFAFHAGASTLPAGNYKVTEAGAGIFLIRGEKSAVFVPKSAVFVDSDELGRVTFRFTLAGEKYALSPAQSGK